MSAEQIIQALREKGIRQSQVAELLGLPRSGAHMLFSGRRMMRLDEANKLLALLGDAPQTLELPVIGMAGAGRWVEAVEESNQTISIPGELEAKGRFAVQVAGRSMNLILPEGSFAVVDPDDTGLFSGKIYLLLNAEGEGTIKRYKSDPARFEPVSDDPSFEPFEVGAYDFRVVGRVTTALQKL